MEIHSHRERYTSVQTCTVLLQTDGPCFFCCLYLILGRVIADGVLGPASASGSYGEKEDAQRLIFLRLQGPEDENRGKEQK